MVVKILATAAHVQRIKKVAESTGQPEPAVEWLLASNKAEQLALAPEADAIWTGRDDEVIKASPRCKWLQVGSAGVDGMNMELLVERDIVLTNAAVIYGIQLADHNLAFILAFSRQLPFLLDAQKAHQWKRRSDQGETDTGFRGLT
jgi:phosphoglycerate dehydrogenase-like enzyme